MEINDYTKKMLIQKIKADFPGFDEEEILDYTKSTIPNIHLFLSEEKNEQVKRYCTDEMINKMLENKDTYRITKDIDSVRVGYARIEDYKNEGEDVYIKVYSSIFFYDDVSNNENVDLNNNFDKYWNDIWQITYRGDFGKDVITTCPFCNSKMQYNYSKHMYTCENCKNSIYYSKINWKISDIEVNKVQYK